MKRVFIVLCGCLVVFWSLSALADRPFDSHFQQYMAHIEKGGAPVFLDQCIIFENKNTREILRGGYAKEHSASHSIIVRRAAIIAPVGQAKALFVYTGKLSVVNMTTLAWKRRSLKIGDLLGGVYTLLKMDSLIQDLLSRRFSLIPADRLNEILGKQTTTTCSLKKLRSELRNNPLL